MNQIKTVEFYKRLAKIDLKFKVVAKHVGMSRQRLFEIVRNIKQIKKADRFDEVVEKICEKLNCKPKDICLK